MILLTDVGRRPRGTELYKISDLVGASSSSHVNIWPVRKPLTASGHLYVTPTWVTLVMTANATYYCGDDASDGAMLIKAVWTQTGIVPGVPSKARSGRVPNTVVTQHPPPCTKSSTQWLLVSFASSTKSCVYYHNWDTSNFLSVDFTW